MGGFEKKDDHPLYPDLFLMAEPDRDMVQHPIEGCTENAVWHSKEQLVGQLMEYVKTYNSTRAKPFKWTYTGVN